jgi:hypothetical protein
VIARGEELVALALVAGGLHNCDTAGMAIAWVRVGETTQERSDALNASRRHQAGDGAGADRPAEPLVEGVVLGAQSVALPG